MMHFVDQSCNLGLLGSVCVYVSSVFVECGLIIVLAM